jgi:hypothetical protein
MHACLAMSATEQSHEAHQVHANGNGTESDEPSTPPWLTILGIVLFVGAGLAYIVTRPSGATLEQLRNASVTVSASAVASQVAPPPAPAPAPVPTPAASPAGSEFQFPIVRLPGKGGRGPGGRPFHP